MSWWKKALFDTCSLISVDKIVQIDSSLKSHFTNLLALEDSFTVDQMRQEHVQRLQSSIEVQELPPLSAMSSIFGRVQPSKALAQVDKLILVTAVHFNLSVVTADKRLAKALIAEGCQVSNIALILKELVTKRRVSQKQCTDILRILDSEGECLIAPFLPEWDSLKGYTFP